MLDTTGQTVIGLNFIRENLRKERNAQENWKNRYGHKYEKKVVVSRSERPAFLDKKSTSNSPDTESDDEEELRRETEDELNGGKVSNGGLAKFVGGYVPSGAGDERKSSFATTAVVTQQDLQDAIHDSKLRVEHDRQNFKTRDWLKSYFEEESKAKNILKRSGPATASK